MKKALYIEDSAMAQVLMRRYLQGTCELTIVESPRRALGLWAAGGFDLVISDFQFPDCDAFDLLVEMRRSRSALDLPIIVVSSSMDGPLQSKLLAAGVNTCLSKPLMVVDFKAIVIRMLAEPFVENPAQSVVGVCCFRWCGADSYHEYCPELNLHLTGKDPAEIAVKMQATIQSRLSEGAVLGGTTRERTTTYLVHRG